MRWLAGLPDLIPVKVDSPQSLTRLGQSTLVVIAPGVISTAKNVSRASSIGLLGACGMGSELGLERVALAVSKTVDQA